MALTLDECLDACGITDQICDEVPDSIARTASNIYFAPEDLALLVDALAAANSIPVNGLDSGVPTSSMSESISSGSDAVILPADRTIKVQDDGKQEHPVAPSTVILPSDIELPDADMQQNFVNASTDVSSNTTETPDDDNQQQHPIEAFTYVLPGDIELSNAEIQQTPIDASTVVLPSDTEVSYSNLQQTPIDASTVVLPSDTEIPYSNLQQNSIKASTVILPSATEVFVQQHFGKASSVVSPCPIKDHDDDMRPNLAEDSTAVLPNTIEMIKIDDDHMRQQHPVEASHSRNVPEEKGIDSYVQVIATTILQSPHQKLLIKEMYESITKNWSKFSLNESTWKNSVRHALSTNTFFVQNGRGPAGRAKYWSVHEACVSMFKNGNFHSREARSRVQKMGRETKKRQAKKGSSSQGNTKSMAEGKSEDNKDAIMQQHHFRVKNVSSNIKELNYPSSSSMSSSAPYIQQQYQQQQQQQLKYQQLQKQHQVQYQQQSQHHDLYQYQQQEPLQHIQNPQYVQQTQQQLPQAPQHQQQQLFQYQQRQQRQQCQQQFQYQEQHLPQYQHRQQHQNQQDQHCWFDNYQNSEFQQSYVRNQPQDMTSSKTGYNLYDNHRSAMDYNTLNNPAPSQCTSNTGYYNTAQQQQQEQCYQQY